LIKKEIFFLEGLYTQTEVSIGRLKKPNIVTIIAMDVVIVEVLIEVHSNNNKFSVVSNQTTKWKGEKDIYATFPSALHICIVHKYS